MPGTRTPLSFAEAGCLGSPVALGSRWMTVVDNSALTTGSNGAVTDPETQIPSGCTIVCRKGRASVLRVRLVRASTISDTFARVSVFGRTLLDGESAGGQVWQNIRNRAGSLSADLGVSATDIQDGTSPTLYRSNPDNSLHAWDVEGYDQLVLGIEVKWTPDGGDTSARLEARMY